MIYTSSQQIQLEETLQQPQVREYLSILLEYLVYNDYRLVCKRVFKVLELEVLGKSVLSNRRVNAFVNSYYIDLVYQQYH